MLRRTVFLTAASPALKDGCWRRSVLLCSTFTSRRTLKSKIALLSNGFSHRQPLRRLSYSSGLLEEEVSSKEVSANELPDEKDLVTVHTLLKQILLGSYICDGKVVILWRLKVMKLRLIEYVTKFPFGKDTFTYSEGALDFFIKPGAKAYKIVNREVTDEDRVAAKKFAAALERNREEKEKAASS
ncbi:unnamed protein product [Enterobius vermicularis]|uniref:Uncharacterized protein n=1 Tax=Enterobius vermicularis TaxID=51028 RepID=A0A0N4VFM0_ENTVE|nr:unnamed protein product [Enterobius vermicularis]